MNQFSIKTNITSMIAQNAFSKNTAKLQDVMNKLSTGLKINTAKDDPAGLTITTRLSSEIVGNSQAMENIQMGISVLNIAEGDMNSISNDLARIRDLCVQAANGFYTKESKEAFLAEIKSRLENIDYISQSTEFGGKKLLDGSVKRMLIQAGYASDANTNTVDLATALQNCKTDETGLDIQITKTAEEITPDDFAEYMERIDTAISKVASYKSNAGALYNRLESTYESVYSSVDNQTAAKSSILDADIAQLSSDMIKYQILQQSSASMLTQANSFPEMALSLLRR